MAGGPLMLLRRSLESARYARPWQQGLIATAMIAGGVALAIVGLPAPGLLLAVVGCMFFFKRAQLWLARRGAGSR